MRRLWVVLSDNGRSDRKPQEERREVEMLRKLGNLFRDEKGQDIIEYGLLASFISVVAVAVLKLFGPLVISLYNSVVTAMTP